MESISGPAESLSSEFRLQQKRLMREIAAVVETLSSLRDGHQPSHLQEDIVSTLENLEAKISHLIAKEKESSLRVLYYLPASHPAPSHLIFTSCLLLFPVRRRNTSGYVEPDWSSRTRISQSQRQF